MGLRWLSGLVVALLTCGLALCQQNLRSWNQQQPGSMRRGSLQSGWGSARGVSQLSRQTSAPSWSPVTITCLEDMMVVTVQKNLYGNGKLIKSSDLTLGPAKCKPSSDDGPTVVFQNLLQDCGTTVQTNANFLLYTTSLAYQPSSSRNIPITRTNSANIGVQCYYPRHGNVSSKAIKPTWIPYSSTISIEERLSFALNLMSDDWSGLRDSKIVSLGNSLNIEASVNVENHIPMRIVVDSCTALLTPDPNSTPKYDLINNYGCLVDGQQEDSSSTFISQRPEPNRLRFQIDAFRFTDYNQPSIYISCVLKAVPLDQSPDSTNKACSFSKTSNLWSPVEGAANICSCCDSGNCDGAQPRWGNPRRVRPGSRRHWKRHQAGEHSDEVIHEQLLGPIWVVYPEGDFNAESEKALAVHADSEQEVKPWMVAAVGGLWVVVVVGAVLTWRVKSRKSNVTTVQWGNCCTVYKSSPCSPGLMLLITMGLRWLSELVVALLTCGLALCQQNPRSWNQQQPGSMRRGSLQSGWGSARGVPQLSRQTSAPSWSPITITCLEDMMVVTVQKNLYGNGKLIKSSDLALGLAKCKPSSDDGPTVVFQNLLQDCGTTVQMNVDFLLYATNLAYQPSSSRNIPITRTNSANISVQCYYPRHGNVSSKAIKPTWIPYSSTISIEERLSFALNLMNDDWSGLRGSSIVSLGNSLNIEASVNVENHIPMRIVVDSCVALLTPDPNSTPKYDLINNYGCLVDGQQEDSSSTFISQRPEPNRLRFQIDAFRFTDYNQPTIYISCVLKAVPLDQSPDPTNKACSFSKTSNSWSPVEGAANICSCCGSGNCDGAQPRWGDPRRVRPGSRRHWKRHQAGEHSDDVIHEQFLGPIWVVYPEGDFNAESEKALAVHADSEQEVKPWMVAAVGGLWVVVVIGAVLTWKVKSRKCNVATVQQ
ncbi:uncharacterized protein ACMZJ9_022291 [Mantella aurantiaca]